MAKSARETLGVELHDEPMEGQESFDLPGTIAPDRSQLVTFTPPAKSQLRRHLREDELLSYIKDQVSGGLAEDDPRAVMEMFGQIVRADSFEQLLEGQDTIHGHTILDTTLEVWSIKFLRSSQPKGCPFFCLLDAKDTRNKAPALVDVGGWKVVGMLAFAHYVARELPEGSPWLVPAGTPGAVTKHEYPFYFKIRKQTTSAGFDINLLESPMA